MRYSVYIVDDGNEAKAVREMFIREGWDIAEDINDADLVQFVGGADVSPELYKQRKHITTYTDPARDELEQQIYLLALEQGIPMAGICRGGQFLNVMNGGKLWQDVDGHQLSGTHKAWIDGAILPIDVNSVHHQMIEPNWYEEHIILMRARESTKKHAMSQIDMSPYAYAQYPMKGSSDRPTDIEAMFYVDTRCLCYQPHPEYMGEYSKETREVYFMFLRDYIFDVKQRDVIAV